MRKKTLFIPCFVFFFTILLFLMSCDYRDPVTTDKTQSSIYHLTLTTDRNEIFADNGKTVARISAFLQNDQLEPLGGREISFSVTSGVISSPVTTSANGVAVATFDDEGVPAEQVRIIARYSDAQNNTVRDTIYVKVSPIESLVSSIKISARPQIIVVTKPDSTYSSTISAQVVDSLGVPVKNVPVFFSNVSGVGIIGSPADTTNSLGQASIEFYTTPGDFGTVKIAAFISQQSVLPRPIGKSVNSHLSDKDISIESPHILKGMKGAVSSVAFSKPSVVLMSDTVEISILPPSAYNLKVVASTDTIFSDNGATTAEISAILKDAEGQPVSGASISFSSSLGVIQSPVVTSETGVAKSVFTDLGSEADTGRAIIVVRYQPDFQSALVETTFVAILPQPAQQRHIPDEIQFSVQYDQLPAGENGEITTSEVTVLVTDSSGYPADPGYLVTFSTNIGYISPYGILNNQGKASATFSMGTSAGNAVIKARCASAVDSTVINIQSSIPNYIVIKPAVPNEIMVQGGGGVESTTLTAELYDANGQYVNVPYLVHFKLGPAPSGTNINNQGLEDSTYSNHGIASVTLNSGTNVGPVKVTVTVRINSSTVIQASSVPVTVIAGPPTYIYPDFSFLDIEPIGGGVYQMEASAIVQDIYTNPVQDSTHVYFWVTDPNGNSIPGVDVVGIGFTGSENLQGEKYPGIAWTRIYYNSDNIFENMILHSLTWGLAPPDSDSTIVDTVYGSNPPTGLPPSILPLYDGTLIVSPTITFWDFANGDPIQVPVMAFLIDYYQNPVDSGRVMFFTTGGNVITPNPTYTDNNGMATCVVQFESSLCTPIPNTDPQQYNPYTAYVWGQTLDPNQVSSDQVAIELRRSPDTGRISVELHKVSSQGNP